MTLFSIYHLIGISLITSLIYIISKLETLSSTNKYVRKTPLIPTSYANSLKIRTLFGYVNTLLNNNYWYLQKRHISLSPSRIGTRDSMFVSYTGRRKSSLYITRLVCGVQKKIQWHEIISFFPMYCLQTGYLPLKNTP